KHSFSAMENLLYGWHEKQLTTLADIRAYEEKQAALLEKAKVMLSAIAIERRPNPQDIRLYTRFRSEYGYTDEVILFAAELAQASANPIAALTAIMNRWHESGVKTLEEAKLANERFRGKTTPAGFEEHQYSADEIEMRKQRAIKSLEDKIYDDFADI
ncbi:MAG: DnaD domain protein, partial [Christensenellaceae bacterium]|nr:DnaD domain protein [Christensenellaceae bacterium]